MRLLRVGSAGREVPCALDAAGTVRDLSSWIAGLGAPVAGAAPDWAGPALDPLVLADLAARLDRDADTLPAVPGDLRVGPPVRPGTIYSIGLNYVEHAREAGLDLPDEPIVATKAVSALAGPYDDLLLPPNGTEVDWEVELAVVIGRVAGYLAGPDEAMSHVAGYCTANDLSERDWLLRRGGEWVKGKSFPSFAPLGPQLVTTDEIADPQALRLRCWVNGELVQDGSTADMRFGVAHLVWYVSQFVTLHPGDVLETGSPAGNALGTPGRDFLRAGDVVEVDVQGLGAQRRTCRDHAVTADRSAAAPRS